MDIEIQNHLGWAVLHYIINQIHPQIEKCGSLAHADNKISPEAKIYFEEQLQELRLVEKALRKYVTGQKLD